MLDLNLTLSWPRLGCRWESRGGIHPGGGQLRFLVIPIQVSHVLPECSDARMSQRRPSGVGLFAWAWRTLHPWLSAAFHDECPPSVSGLSTFSPIVLNGASPGQLQRAASPPRLIIRFVDRFCGYLHFSGRLHLTMLLLAYSRLLRASL